MFHWFVCLSLLISESDSVNDGVEQLLDPRHSILWVASVPAVLFTARQPLCQHFWPGNSVSATVLVVAVPSSVGRQAA
jgi:hypothetical protein